MTRVPDVTVIIVHFNQKEATLSLLDSLMIQTWNDFTVIIMDNHSSPENTISRKDHPRIDELVYLEKNLGYAGALNRGIERSSSPLLLLLNNDVIFPPEAVQKMVSLYRSHPEYGLLCPVLEQADRTIEYAGYTPIHPLTGRNKAIATLSEDAPEIIPTVYAHGAVMMVSREVVLKAGLLPEIFFLYYEELDWSLHIRKNGFKIGVTRDIRVQHMGSLSTSMDGAKTYFINRNRILFMRRNQSGFALIIFFLLFALVAVPAKIIHQIFSEKKAPVKIYFRAIKWNLTHGIR